MQPGDRRKRCSSEMVRRLQCETARRLREQERRSGSYMWQPGDRRSMRDKTAPLQDTGRRCQLEADRKDETVSRRHKEPIQREVNPETTRQSLMNLARSCCNSKAMAGCQAQLRYGDKSPGGRLYFFTVFLQNTSSLYFLLLHGDDKVSGGLPSSQL